MYVKVQVTPGARKERVEDSGEVLQIWVKEPAERNLANRRVVEIVQMRYKAKKVRLVSGHRSTSKIFSIDPVRD